MASKEEPSKMLDFIVATGPNGEFACKEGLPWKKIPSDMEFFRQTTLTTINPNKVNALIMGRLTYESLPGSPIPLKGRLSIIISSLYASCRYKDSWTVQSLEEALFHIDRADHIENVFVIGGERIFSEVMAQFPDRCRSLYHTLVPPKMIKGTEIRCLNLSEFIDFFDDIPVAGFKPVRLEDGTIRTHVIHSSNRNANPRSSKEVDEEQVGKTDCFGLTSSSSGNTKPKPGSSSGSVLFPLI